jgi:hypothetical protein
MQRSLVTKHWRAGRNQSPAGGGVPCAEWSTARLIAVATLRRIIS